MSEAIVSDAYRRLMEELDWTTWEEKAVFFGELKGLADEKGWKPGLAAMKYKERFGSWPNDARVKSAAARPCGTATRLWVNAGQEGVWRKKRGK